MSFPMFQPPTYKVKEPYALRLVNTVNDCRRKVDYTKKAITVKVSVMIVFAFAARDFMWPFDAGAVIAAGAFLGTALADLESLPAYIQLEARANKVYHEAKAKGWL